MGKKLTIITTYGPENPEKATLPFVVATAAQALDIEVGIWFQSASVETLVKGAAEKINAHGFPKFKDLLDIFIEAGGKFMVCSPCIKSRGITPDDLIPEAVVTAAATGIQAMMEADQVLGY